MDDETLALATVSLAAKVSEKPRRLRELLLPAYNLLHPGLPKLTFPSDLYDRLRASLVKAELMLLRILQFDLRLATPYEYLDDLLRDFLSFQKTDSSHSEDYVKVTDSLLGLTAKVTIVQALMNSSVALMFTAKTIATSAIILAANTLRMETPFTNKSDLLGQWIETEAKEDIVDIKECSHLMNPQVDVLVGLGAAEAT